jgi:hypothetical protein
MTPQTLPQPVGEAKPEPSLLDPCTCMRDGNPCRVCRLWDRHLAWLESRPEPESSE